MRWAVARPLIAVTLAALIDLSLRAAFGRELWPYPLVLTYAVLHSVNVPVNKNACFLVNNYLHLRALVPILPACHEAAAPWLRPLLASLVGIRLAGFGNWSIRILIAGIVCGSLLEGKAPHAHFIVSSIGLGLVDLLDPVAALGTLFVNADVYTRESRWVIAACSIGCVGLLHLVHSWDVKARLGQMMEDADW